MIMAYDAFDWNLLHPHIAVASAAEYPFNY